jgi:predicted DNA-binding protein
MKRDIKFEIRLSKEEMERIEKVANKLGIPKARLIRNLTLAGLEDAELLEKLGLYDIIKLIEKIREKALGNKNITKYGDIVPNN